MNGEELEEMMLDIDEFMRFVSSATAPQLRQLANDLRARPTCSPALAAFANRLQEMAALREESPRYR